MVSVKVESLWKQYQIGLVSKEKYHTLREWIATRAKSAVQFLRTGQPKNKPKECFWALQDVSFELNQGDRLGVIGRNGAGKSTLLKVMSRITEPTRGKITLRGKSASLLEVGTGFHPELTGHENIFLNGALLGMTKLEIKKRYDEIVAFAEVEKFLATPVKRYSSGMYVRLAFSIAAHLEPDILILDEVLAVGDARFQKKCLEKVNRVSKEGRTIIFVSHNMGAVNALCTKSLLLQDGKVASFGPTAEVMGYYNREESLASEVQILSKMRQRGGEEIRFIKCGISDLSGKGKNHFLIGEQFKLRFKFSSAFQGMISFWLIIFDAQGTAILSSHQRDYEWVQVQQGMFEVTFVPSDFWLTVGTYSISAGVFNKNLDFLEWVDGCQTFEIYPSFQDGLEFDGRWGLVNQKAKWRMINCVEAESLGV